MTLQTQASFLNQRQAGVLLHISSLPSAFYTGDLGVESYRFIDFLHEIGAKVWQTLPINMPHADNSPYQCLSAHAGNPDFISLETLQAQGLLTKDDCAGLITSKLALLDKAYVKFSQQSEGWPEHKKLHQAFTRFCKKQASWLDDFSLFLALRRHFNEAGWSDWPAPYKNRDKETLKQVQAQLAHEVAVVKFTQFVFFSQWIALKQYAAEKNIALFGDIPIFVAYDSADVWAHSDLFKLNADKTTSVVAGVPPDYFSETGQRWGNPHYNWDAMQRDGFGWWVSRMATQNELFDIVRIDHFRGLEAAWEIPSTEETAINGEWVLAPGDALLAAIKQALPEINLVAEDLGIITVEVEALRKKYHLPGMKILQFAFSGTSDNPYLPENISENSVVYTGTHDNDTTLSWYSSLDDHQRGNLHAYLAKNHHDEYVPNMPHDLIEMALQTKALLAIVPMQDILELNGQHRMNTPGTVTGNWHWRFGWQQLRPEQKTSIRNGILASGR
ncbi:MAG: 4-alpha-glucanotransferase [Methylotenera sp.]|uniref:4-alpha-glucanotransferase n=1 Tax=Methylotenera sp. TaxID=2051956 RepID=UPI000D46A3C3|nr:4-alpha-glucanotransferase [Methylotenera sp.]PPC81636.1 MAG: 4-alpha-glucanotransferase [Methylotenera sp.]